MALKSIMRLFWCANPLILNKQDTQLFHLFLLNGKNTLLSVKSILYAYD